MLVKSVRLSWVTLKDARLDLFKTRIRSVECGICPIVLLSRYSAASVLGLDLDLDLSRSRECRTSREQATCNIRVFLRVQLTPTRYLDRFSRY